MCIKLKECVTNKWDVTTSLYISELISATRNGKLKWSYDEEDIYCQTLIATYVNKHGMKVNCELTMDYGVLTLNYNNKNKRIVKYISELNYEQELIELIKAIDDNLAWYNPFTKPVEPVKPIVTRVKTARGIKAEKLLKDVEYDYNIEILGE